MHGPKMVAAHAAPQQFLARKSGAIASFTFGRLRFDAAPRSGRQWTKLTSSREPAARRHGGAIPHLPRYGMDRF